MAFHIPFEHRHRGQPIYIGFDAPPPRPRRRWNWWGFFGFGLSLLALPTAGLLSPVALLLSLIGMRRQPRRLATAGAVLSGLGTLMLAGLITAGVTAHQRHEQAREANRNAQRNRVNVSKTSDTMKVALAEFKEFSEANQGNLPAWIDANMVAIKHKDAWGESLRFDVESDGAKLRSAGADRKFDTRDDVITKVDGQVDRRTLHDL